MTSIAIKVPNWLDRIFAWPMMVWRRHKYGYDYRRIYLGEGEWTIVDQQDYYRLCNFKWHVNGTNGKFYAVRQIKVDNKHTKRMYLHREIMNAPKGMLVDHKDGNSFDNRRANLLGNPVSKFVQQTKKSEYIITVYRGLLGQGEKKMGGQNKVSGEIKDDR